MLFCVFDQLVRNDSSAKPDPASSVDADDAPLTWSRAAFCRTLFPDADVAQPRAQNLSASFFAEFDPQRTGAIDFCAFVGALSPLCSVSSAAARVAALFNALDFDRDGLLQRGDLTWFARMALASLPTAPQPRDPAHAAYTQPAGTPPFIAVVATVLSPTPVASSAHPCVSFCLVLCQRIVSTVPTRAKPRFCSPLPTTPKGSRH